MKVLRVEKIFIVMLMVIFGGIVLHAPLSVGLGVLFPSFDLVIKSWKEILMIALVPLGISIVVRRQLWRELVDDWIFRIIAVYAALHLMLIGFSYKSGVVAAAGLAIDLRYLLFFTLVYVAMRALPQYRRRMLQVATIGAFIVVGFATLQLFLPADILTHIGYSKDTIDPYLTVDKNPNYVRVNSTLRGPNPLGAYASMTLGLLTAALVRAKLRLSNKKVFVGAGVLAVCGMIALWISYSRSALGAGILTVFIVIMIAAMRKLSRRVWIVSVIVLFAVAGALVAVKGSTFVSNVLLHENPADGSAVTSNDDHITSIQAGFINLIHQPLGTGVGSTGSASLLSNQPVVIENQYLFIAHETGWLGLALFAVLYILILSWLWRGRNDWLRLGVFASGIGLGVIGLLLPVWADDTVSIIWWGLAAIALAGGRHVRKQTK